MKELIEAIFGQYVPIITEEVVNIDGVDTVVARVASGSAGVDWSYILGVAGFFLVLWCVLRIIGGVVTKC